LGGFVLGRPFSGDAWNRGPFSFAQDDCEWGMKQIPGGNDRKKSKGKGKRKSKGNRGSFDFASLRSG